MQEFINELDSPIDKLPPGFLKHFFLSYCPNDLPAISSVNKKWNSFFIAPEEGKKNNLYHKKNNSALKLYTQHGSMYAVTYVRGQCYLFKGSVDSPLDFRLLIAMQDIQDIAIGDGHMLIRGLNTSGQSKVWITGHNEEGQLGEVVRDNNDIDLNELKTFKPASVPESLIEISGICAGKNYSLVWGYSTNNQVQIWGTGKNNFGQLGTGDKVKHHEWAKINIPIELQQIRKICAGEVHTMIWGIDENNKPGIWASGHIAYCSFANINDYNKNTFVSCNLPDNLKEIIDVSVGNSHNMMWGVDQENNHQIWMSGQNYRGQLGIGDTKNRSEFTLSTPEKLKTVKGVCAAGEHSLVWGRDDEGHMQIWASGYNNQGQLAMRDCKNSLSWTLCKLPQDLSNIVNVHTQDNRTFIQGYDKNHHLQVWFVGNDDHEFRLSQVPVLNTKILSPQNGLPDSLKIAYINLEYVMRQDSQSHRFRRKFNAKVMGDIKRCVDALSKNELTIHDIETAKNNIKRYIRNRKIQRVAIIVLMTLIGILIGPLITLGLIFGLVLPPIAVFSLCMLAVALSLVFANCFGVIGNKMTDHHKISETITNCSNQFFVEAKKEAIDNPVEENDNIVKI